jgi:hypothetical protein
MKWKAKKEEEELLNTCTVTAKKARGEEDSYKDPSPGDFIVHETVGGMSIPMIIPTSIIGCDKGLCLDDDASIWYINNDAPGCKTSIPMPNYCYHMVHHKYINHGVHAKLCGKIVE